MEEEPDDERLKAIAARRKDRSLTVSDKSGFKRKNLFADTAATSTVTVPETSSVADTQKLLSADSPDLAVNALIPMQKLRYPESVENIFCSAFSDRGDYFAIGFGAGIIKLFQTSTTEEVCMVKCTPSRKAPFLNLKFHPTKNPPTVYGTGATGYIYSASALEENFSLVLKEEENSIYGFDFNMFGDLFVTAGKDIVIRVYNTETKQKVIEFNSQELEKKLTKVAVSGHTMVIYCARFHPDNPDLIFTAGWDNTVKAWDRRFPGSAVRSILGPHICGEGIDIKDNSILTASWAVRNALQLWDLRTCKLIDSFPLKATVHQPEQLYFAHFIKHPKFTNYILCGGSGTNSCQLVDSSSKAIMGELVYQKAVVTGISSRERFGIGCVGNQYQLAALDEDLIKQYLMSLQQT